MGNTVSVQHMTGCQQCEPKTGTRRVPVYMDTIACKLPGRIAMRPYRNLILPIGAGERLFVAEKLFGRAFEHHFASLAAALWTHINNPICILYNM